MPRKFVLISQLNSSSFAGSALCFGLLAGLAGCGVSRIATPISPVGSGTSVAAGFASRPTLAYLWDASRAGLRPLFGVPGAASLGSNSYAPGNFVAAVPCVKQRFALLTDLAGAVSLITLPSGQVTEISETLSTHQRILLSPSCSSALIYAPDSTSGILISGLPSAPRSQSISLSASITGAAVADSGSVLFATLRGDGASAVQVLVSGAKSATPVSVLASFGGMAFLPDADTAVLADSGQNTLSLVSQVSSSAISAEIASASDGVAHPMALASAGDGRSVIVLNGGGASLLRIDLSGSSAPTKIPGAGSPTELVPLSGNAVFQLNEPSAGTVYAFDGDSVAQRIVFLPACIPATAKGATR